MNMNSSKTKMVFAVIGIIVGILGTISSIGDVITTKQEMNESKENN